MGRPPIVSKEEAIQLIQKYMEFFTTNEFPSNSAQVWKDDEQRFEWKVKTAFGLYPRTGKQKREPR